MQYALCERRWEPSGGSASTKVLISEDARRSVVFIGDDNPKFVARGTAFFVITDGPAQAGYLVTAAHIARDLAGPFKFRANDRSGAGHDEVVSAGSWLFHADPTVDIAVLRLDVPQHLGVRPYELKYVLDERRRVEKGIGHGSATYTVGLFNRLGERDKITPVTLTGHIALLPDDEKIPVQDWTKKTGTVRVEGYLIQSASVGGVSGSPVYVCRPVPVQKLVYDRDSPLYSGMDPQAYGAVFLLGISQGTWFVDPETIESELLMQIASLRSRSGGSINPTERVQLCLGMSITVPGERLLDIIDSPSEQARRAQEVLDRDAAIAASPTSVRMDRGRAREHHGTEANPRHREDFNRLLDAAARQHRVHTPDISGFDSRPCYPIGRSGKQVSARRGSRGARPRGRRPGRAVHPRRVP